MPTEQIEATSRALVVSGEIIDGEYEVVGRPPTLQWSFWEDDFPRLVQMILVPPIAGLMGWALYRLFWS